MKVVPFKKPYRPDPRNGEVYATEFTTTRYVNGTELEETTGFAFIHMSAGGGSAGFVGGFASMQEAKEAARKHAEHLNAEFVG